LPLRSDEAMTFTSVPQSVAWGPERPELSGRTLLIFGLRASHFVAYRAASDGAG
jgi:hypothetical protein